MLQAAEQLSPQLLNERGLAEWGRCLRLPYAEREAELTRLQIRLKPLQAVCLIEAHYMRGLFAALSVGRGKTLLSWLLPFMFDDVRRPVLILPGGLKSSKTGKLGKTEHEFERIRIHWKTPRYPVKLLGYEFLSRKEQAEYLCSCEKCTGRPLKPGEVRDPGLQPDLIIPDESDMLKHTDVGKTRRIIRYVTNHMHVIFIPMTGTMVDRSLRDFSHLMMLALKHNCPLPMIWHSLEGWCQALDDAPRDGVRKRPGALLKLAPELPSDSNTITPLEAARVGVQLRMSETPGVIMDEEQSCDLPITIRLIKPPDDPVLEAAFYHFRETGFTPDGWDVSANFEKTNHGQTLGCGFYNMWDPRPPQEWSDARRAYHKLIRSVIENSERRGKPIDTEAHAIAEGGIKDHPDVREWRRIEPTFKPNSVPVWISPSVLGFAAEWIRVNGPALIWTQHIPVGQALEAMTGVSYYGAAGLNQYGALLDNADTSKSAIVSVDANMRGRNLWGWNKCLVIAPSQTPKDWEQGVLGRMHRTGQTKPVHADVIVSSADSLYALEKACERCRYIEQSSKFTYKLLLATWDWSAFPIDQLSRMPVEDPRRARWVRGDIKRQPEILSDLVV